jgi:GntR family transcriptional repressor for pyruvate dehydrogenase complex
VEAPISRGTVVDALVDRVRADVLTGRYPAGSLLPPERELASAYQVTRTTLKHALVRLVEVGLLETKHGVGTRVRDFERSASIDLLPILAALAGPDWLREIFEARREIGALIAERAAGHASAQDRSRLRELLAELGRASGVDAVQLAECEVHRVLAAASGNRVYGLVANALLNAYLEVRQLFTEPFVDAGAAADRLAPVVRAVCAGDATGARRAADAYLRETQLLMLGGGAP